jgi:hypothetical protein
MRRAFSILTGWECVVNRNKATLLFNIDRAFIIVLKIKEAMDRGLPENVRADMTAFTDKRSCERLGYTTTIEFSCSDIENSVIIV